MAALFANPLVQAFLGWLGKLIWGKLSDVVKDRLAHEQIQKNVKAVMEKYEAVIMKYDDLNDQGLLTEDMKNELRKEKIKLEEDLINNIQP